MSNLYKGFSVSLSGDKARVIDSNERVASRIEMLAAVMQSAASEDDDFEDGFSEGLNADKVEMLLSDAPEGEDGAAGNVIKAAPPEPEIDTEAILNEAREEAEQIRRAAMEEAEMIKERAQREASEEGYQAGYRDGMEKAEAARQEAMSLKISLQEEYRKKIDELEPMFVDTLTDVFEHVFHVSLSNNKEIIFYLIQDAVRNIEDNKNFIIHVSREDYGFVSMQKKELLTGLAGGDMAEIVEDMTLGPNECLIETGNGIFDCSLETQLQGLKRELRLLSYKPSGK